MLRFEKRTHPNRSPVGREQHMTATDDTGRANERRIDRMNVWISLAESTSDADELPVSHQVPAVWLRYF